MAASAQLRKGFVLQNQLTPPHTAARPDMNQVLPARHAYRLWAASYDSENPVTQLDQAAVVSMTPNLAGRSLLDAGCGTGRRLPRSGRNEPRLAIGMDLVREMLDRKSGNDSDSRTLVVGDLEALPFANSTFDVVWCRLVMGHIRTIDGVYRQLARVTRKGGTIIITDFHPDAAEAGYARRFEGVEGQKFEVEHHIHSASEHLRSAAASGIELVDRLDPRIGPAVKFFYDDAGRSQQYARQKGMPIVLALRFSR